MGFGDLFSFDKMIAPALIKPLYWALVILTVVYGVWMFLWSGVFSIFRSGVDIDDGIINMIWAVVYVAVTVLVLRVLAEVCIALFELHSKSKTGDTPQQSS